MRLEGRAGPVRNTAPYGIVAHLTDGRAEPHGWRGTRRSGGGGVGEPRGEGRGVGVEHDVAHAVGPERGEALEQDGVLRRGELAAQPPLELMLDRPNDGLGGNLGEELESSGA